MLTTQYHNTEHDRWPLRQYGTSSEQQPSQRMPESYVSSLSTQPEWKRRFGFPLHHVAVNASSHFDHTNDPPNLRYPRSNMEGEELAVDVKVKEEGEVSPVYPQTVQSAGLSSPMKNTSRASEDSASLNIGPESAGTSATMRDQNPPSLDILTRVGEPTEAWSEQYGLEFSGEQNLATKDEEDDGIEEEEDDEGELEQTNRPLTAAERSAARRKMKRFRLTHQQTRFLMSEFVKQPHPDAAHRERLSREIPGLSPRQVQVWFQNRRAKIKRMDAEDRDRVIKMRAVPEDFDNIQALHSPYGAVHGLGPSLASAPELGNQPFGGHLTRPLMVDVRRPEADDSISPTGLTPAFEGVGFNPSAVSSSEMISPLSTTSSDRYTTYSNQLASFGGGTRGSTTYPGEPGRINNTLSMGHQAMRPLQPLHLKNSFPRQRADSLQTPLRTIDYGGYQQGGNSSSTMSDRQQSIYQMGAVSTVDSGSYDTESYSGHHAQPSPGQDYPSLQQISSERPRLRASSATFPLNLDLRSQYRQPGQTIRSPGQSTSDHDPTSSTQYTSPSIYTTSYPPAPLTAPINIPQSRSATHSRLDASGHLEQHMSAPNSSAGEFPRSVHGNMATNTSSHTPMRDSFTTGALPFSPSQDRPRNFDGYDGPGVMKRKPSYTSQGGGIGERTSPGTNVFNHAS